MLGRLAGALGAGVCVIAVAVVAPAPAYAQQVMAYDIRAGSLKSALDAFARQSGRQVIYRVDEVRGARSRGARGPLSAGAALDAILAGTGFAARTDSSGAVAIVRMATGATPGSGEAQAGGAAAVNEGANNEEIVVTGTSIRGQGPTGSPLITHGQEEIQRSGAQSTPDFMRTLPENFSGSDAAANGGRGFAAFGGPSQFGNNSFYQAAPNIHGAGPQATLTLVNGHRVAPSGLSGQFVDIGSIPLSAVHHIEVLTDGASAVYGSDAIAGVVNFVLKRDFNGAETGLSYSATTRGGAQELNAHQLFGVGWRSGQVMLAFDLARQDNLLGSERDFVPASQSAVTLIPRQERKSALLIARQDLTDRLHVSLDAFYGVQQLTGDAEDGFNNISRTDTDVTNYGGTVGLTVDVGAGWTAEATGGYFRVNEEALGTFISPFGNFESASSVKLDTMTGDFIFSGPVVQLPGGDVRIATGASFRRDAVLSHNTGVEGNLDRDVHGFFGEMFIPLIGEQNAVAIARRLGLSLAIRYDHYSDFGGTTNPRVGVRYEPFAGLEFRASYGRSFRAPTVDQLIPQASYFTQNIPAPGGIKIDTLTDVSGGNPDLGPERSRNYTGGFDWRPPSAPGLEVHVTYYNLRYEDRIGAFPFDVATLYFLDPSISSPFLLMNPDAALVHSYFTSPGFRRDFARLGEAGVRAIFDSRVRNLNSTMQDGLDVRAQFAWGVGSGQLTLGAAANYIFNYNFRLTEASPEVQVANTLGQPVKLRVNAYASWVSGNWSASATVNHWGAYENNLFTPSHHIEAWTTADVGLAYRFGEGSGPLTGLRASLSVRNLFNQDPPFVDGPANSTLTGYDSANATPLGRVISVGLTKTW